MAPPSHPRKELDDVLATVLAVPFELDVDKFQHNLRTGRRGAAGGPSGMSGEHLKIVLESPACTALLSESASQLARAEMLEEIVKAIWVGRMTILKKPGGPRNHCWRRFSSFGVPVQYALSMALNVSHTLSRH